MATVCNEVRQKEAEFWDWIILSRYSKQLDIEPGLYLNDFCKRCRLVDNPNTGQELYFEDELIAWLGPYQVQETDKTYVLDRVSWTFLDPKTEEASTS